MGTSFDPSQLEELVNAINLVRLTNYGIGELCCPFLHTQLQSSLLVCCCTFLCYDIALNAALEVNQALFVARLLILTIWTDKLYLEVCCSACISALTMTYCIIAQNGPFQRLRTCIFDTMAWHTSRKLLVIYTFAILMSDEVICSTLSAGEHVHLSGVLY